jgi:FMN phosphatase YigB (HAD superfamily)
MNALLRKIFRKLRTGANIIYKSKSIVPIISLIRINVSKKFPKVVQKIHTQDEWEPQHFKLADYPEQSSQRIALVIHVFYEDFVDTFTSIALNFKHPFTLLATTPNETIATKISQSFLKIDNCQDARIIVTPNRGRNFGPLLVEFGNSLLNEFDLFLHLHSKKSFYNGQAQIEWSDYLLNSLAGDSETITRIISAFDSEEKLGLVYPTTFKHMHPWVHSWLQNFQIAKELREKLNLLPIPTDFHIYPVGGMFWARTNALQDLLSHDWVYEDFPEESGQKDGTLQHALERLLDDCVESKGMHSCYIYKHKLTLDRSFAWKHLLGVDKDVFEHRLRNFDVLSWDLFDTLIYRLSGQPDFAKFRVGELLVKKGLIESALDFVTLRNSAEAEIRDRLLPNRDVGIFDVYSLLIKKNCWVADPNELSELEFNFDLEEFEVRPDISEVFSSLSHKSYIISDTYYSKVQVVRILHKLGLSMPLDIFASSSIGKRKDRGDLWIYFKKAYVSDPKLHLHIGDNSVSDNQIPSDMGMNTFKIYSSLELNHMLQREYFKKIDLMEYVSSVDAKKLSKLQQKYLQSPFIFGD